MKYNFNIKKSHKKITAYAKRKELFGKVNINIGVWNIGELDELVCYETANGYIYEWIDWETEPIAGLNKIGGIQTSPTFPYHLFEGDAE